MSDEIPGNQLPKNETKPALEKDNNRKTMLVVGDWLVDEFWFLVSHQTGITPYRDWTHYRIAIQPGGMLYRLGGAGLLVRVLNQIRSERKKNDFYDLFAAGKWRQGDDEHLQHLLHPEEHPRGCEASEATFSMARVFCRKPPKVELMRLDDCSTTNILIRQYHGINGKYQLIKRVDWMEDMSDKESEKPSQVVTARGHPQEWPHQSAVGAIAIFDLKNGVVSQPQANQELRDQMVKRTEDLMTKYPKVPWYVRSNDRNIQWLTQLKEKHGHLPRVELLLIGPDVASRLNPWEYWLFNGKMTARSWEIFNRDQYNYSNVVLLSHNRDVLARVNKGAQCFTIHRAGEPDPLDQIGWPTAFFAGLVHTMYQCQEDAKPEASLTKEDFRRCMIWAELYGGIKPPASGTRTSTEIDKGSEEHPQAHMKSRRKELKQRIGGVPILVTSWKDHEREWNQATTGSGVITPVSSGNSNKLHLDLWRAWTHLPGYVACIERKRKIISRIGRQLREFQMTSQRPRSLSILLQADPGAGKTSLAKSLAKHFKFEYLGFDVTQMISRDELRHLFDLVATRQANTKNKILVFVDEINAVIGGDQIYGAFLAPLEDGVYVRHGGAFSLKPCVWIFAGTKIHTEESEKNNKLSDFKSRMTMIERIDYNSLYNPYDKNDEARVREQARREQVYLGATMITKAYPDVRWVSEDVLQHFYEMDPKTAPARFIRQAAESLENVQYGRVTSSNCPALRQKARLESHDEREEDERLVKLSTD